MTQLTKSSSNDENYGEETDEDKEEQPARMLHTDVVTH